MSSAQFIFPIQIFLGETVLIPATIPHGFQKKIKQILWPMRYDKKYISSGKIYMYTQGTIQFDSFAEKI